MATAYVEQSSDEFVWETDWLETIGDTGPGSANLSLDAQEATLVGLIPWNMQRSAARYFLGFAYYDTDAPYRLHRENPEPHPVFPWLRASNISFTPIAPQKNDATQLPKIESPFYPGRYTGDYQKVVATVSFRSFRMKFLSDDEIESNAKEYKRNTFFDIEPRIQTLSADGVSQMHFDETGPGGPTIGEPFKAPLAALQSMTGFVINWLSVPWGYLSSDTDYFYPTKVLNCVGKLNSEIFLGNLFPGTCLMQPPVFTVKPFPVASDDPRVPLYAVDLQIPFDYYDPPNGDSGSGFYGHTLLPWRGTNDSYHAVREDNVSEVLPSTDFNAIWEYVNE